MKASRPTVIGFIGAVILLLVAGWVIYSDTFTMKMMSYASVVSGASEPTEIRGPKVAHQDMPKEVRAIYMTACYGGSKSLRSGLVKLIDETDLNAIVIDIKDYTGTIAVPTESDILAEGQEGTGCKIGDIKEFVELLHSKGIYVIGRITVFQDPLYAKHHPELAVHKVSAKDVPWKDGKGLSFVDVGATAYWDYVVELAKEAHNILGFDELNFDYIRYPSDGNMADTYYSHSGGDRSTVDMPGELEKFFIYLHNKMSEPNSYGETPKLSADLFGMTTTNYDDLTIGQVLERALPYFDAIGPMVYPSHYPPGFIGLSNPNNDVYRVVNYSMQKAVERTVATSTKIASDAYTRVGTSTPVVYSKPSYSTSKMRPWIQDFDYGGDYGVPEVNAQIQASRDAGVTGGYMIWSPSNKYTRGVTY